MSTHLPGVETGFTAAPREILLSTSGVITIPIVVDGDKSVDGHSPSETYDVRPGWLMGRVTAIGRWTPCKRTRALASSSGGESSSGGDFTVVPVDDASAFRIGDVVSVGADANLTITDIDYDQDQITVDEPIAFAADEVVAAQDGSQTCRGILLDFVRLRNEDNTAGVHKSATLLVAGLVDVDKLLGDAPTIRLDTSAKLSGIRFSDEHGL